MANGQKSSRLEKIGMGAVIGGALVVAVAGAAFIGSLDLVNRAIAFSIGKTYEESRQETKEHIINNFFKEYDTNEDRVIDRQEYEVYVQQRYIDRK